MRASKTKRAGFVVLLGAASLLMAGPASAATGPEWKLDSLSNTTVAPGETIQYLVQATNVGDQPTDGGGQTLAVVLPDGMLVKSATLVIPALFEQFPCFDAKDGTSPPIGTQAIVCPSSAPIAAIVEGSNEAKNDEKLFLTVSVDAGVPLGAQLAPHFEISDGGAATVSIVDSTVVSEVPPPFGIEIFDGLIADDAGNPMTQAGSHPHDYTTYIDFNRVKGTKPIQGEMWPVEAPKSIAAELPAGFVGNPTVAGACTTEQLVGSSGLGHETHCPPTSQVGTVFLGLRPPSLAKIVQGPFPLYNVVPPPGVPARFGFKAYGSLVILDAELRSSGDYGLTVGPRKLPAALAVPGNVITFWGVPASRSHDQDRACPGQWIPASGGLTCESGLPERPFFRLPTSCTAPGDGLDTTLRVDSWQDPGDFVSASYETHKGPGYPKAPSEWGPEIGIDGCENVPVKGRLSAQPTSIETETPSGLEVHVEVPNPGMDNPSGIASSDIKKVRVTLPQGVTINASQAEGLGVCSPSQYESSALSFYPSDATGCPSNSKIGTVEVVTPLLEETLKGEVFVAEQGNNPFNSLLAIYVVIENAERGILIKLPGRVETDERSGRIVTTFDDLPQQPFDSFDFRFREGARAPLVTPPACGAYTTEAEFTGHSDPNGPPVRSSSNFEIVRGIGGGSCPPGGIPPFKPGFSAGSLNPSAGAYSPFTMRLTRSDGEQDLTKFNSVLPPGVSAKIAGVAKCPEASIAIAKTRTGRQEIASPSCPAGSQIGRSLAGAGVGSVITYVPGQIYLAGPWNGAPLSVVAITPAVAGPFDVGTVVVRQALTLDPVTAEVQVDGNRSDPIPHILQGIPLKLRDLRVYVDRSNFTINPTSCDPGEVQATLFGSYADVFDPADDRPVDLASRFQAANCSSLGFKPKLSIKLKGGTKRRDFPGLTAVLRPRPGDANLSRTVVKLPKSAFLEQGHIRTICTRVQWAKDACPKGSVYGKVAAFTPLLDEPLRGNAYLRSSDNKLPDLVFDLKGVVDIEASARIDSVGGGIRATFPSLPDAPLTKVVVQMQGGQKGLIVNSRDLCKAKSKADLQLDGHNGKVRDTRPVVGVRCGKARKGKRRN